MTTDFDDEEFARKLQEEFDAEAKGNKSTASSSTSEIKKSSSMDELKKKQEDMDMEIAMKLQEGEYDPEYKKPPKPVNYYVPPPLVPPPPLFQKQVPDANKLPPTAEAIQRLTSDLKELFTSKNNYIHVMPDDDDITHVQALIVGPPDTPYSHGFYHFDMIYPHDYPWKPPKVQLITTDSGRVRFNPNLYSNGKVCLSILGTWSGPAWTSIQTMNSTLLSIQSLMNHSPYQNEPGYENERSPGDIKNYNDCITHENLRVAVCGMMENPTCGELFREHMDQWFLEKFDEYEKTCLALKDKYDGKVMNDPFGEKRGNFNYTNILKRLRTLKEKLDKKNPKTDIKPMDISTTSTTTTTTTTTNSDNAGTESSPVLVESVQSQLTLDEELALKLSKEINQNPNSLKSPKFSELMKQIKEEKPQETEEQISCIVCHQHPREYVILPACKTPHPYCMTCANKLLKGGGSAYDEYGNPTYSPVSYKPPVFFRGRGRGYGGGRGGYANTSSIASKRNTPTQTLQCVLCSSVSTLDAQGGLNALKRKKKRKVENTKQKDKCPEHNEDFFLFCCDCMEFICPMCAGDVHSNHAMEAYDIAQKRVQNTVKTQLNALKQKKSKWLTFVEDVNKRKATLTTAAEKAKSETEQKFAELRKLLDDKEAEIKASIASIEKSKASTIDEQLSKAKTQVESVISAVAQIEDSLKVSSDPVQFLQAVEEHEEVLRHGATAPDPEVKNNWFLMPKFSAQFVHTSLKALKYKSGNMPKKYGYPMPFPPMPFPLGTPLETEETGEGEEFYEEEEEPTYYADESNDYY